MGARLDGVRFARREPVYSLVIVVVSTLFALLRLRPVVRGAERLPAEGGVVLAVSHFSYLDFAFVGWELWRQRRRPMRYLATKASFEHRLTGPLMRAARHVPVDRAAGAAAYSEAVRVIQTGQVVGIFPETRVSRSYELLDFKTGAARLAAEAGVPLVPITVWGSQRVLTRGRRPRLRELWGAPMTITIGEPLHPGGDAVEDTAELRRVMAAQLEEQRAEFPLDGAGRWWQPARLGGTAPPQG